MKYLKRVLCFSALLIFGSSCSNSSSDDTNEIDVMIEEVKSVVQNYQNLNSANAAGWKVDMSGCVEHPQEGGMGHHFGRLEFIDGRINHKEPQILLFEPLENGGFELVGVEYIIPFEILSSDSEAPELFDEKFHQNHELEIWALHVWTERENPNGMFYDWNPNVSCQHADTT